MERRLKVVAFLVTITLIGCVYWNYIVGYNKPILIVKKYEYITKDYLLQPSKTICAQNPYLIIIVTSYVGHVELRSAHRRAMPTDLLDSMNARRIFLLAKIPDREKSITQEAIKNENEIFEDLLQGSFQEHYRNLTHKHLMGLKWASTQCHASYILKVDDDSVFNLNKTVEYLSKLNNLNRNSILIGYMLNNTIARRQKQNKWYVSWDEYGRVEYPSYLSGWYYITTPEVAVRLAEEAEYHPYFWIDDVYITGILAEAQNIKLKHLPKEFWLEYYELLECCIRDMIEKNIRCDYVIGPNGGRNNLIVVFNEELVKCKNRIECKSNNDTKPSCVVGRDRQLFEEGQAKVQVLKF